MTDEQVEYILDKIGLCSHDMSYMSIICGDNSYALPMKSTSIEIRYAPQLLKIMSFEGSMNDAVLYIDLKSIDSIALYRKEP